MAKKDEKDEVVLGPGAAGDASQPAVGDEAGAPVGVDNPEGKSLDEIKKESEG